METAAEMDGVICVVLLSGDAELVGGETMATVSTGISPHFVTSWMGLPIMHKVVSVFWNIYYLCAELTRFLKLLDRRKLSHWIFFQRQNKTVQ